MQIGGVMGPVAQAVLTKGKAATDGRQFSWKQDDVITSPAVLKLLCKPVVSPINWNVFLVLVNWNQNSCWRDWVCRLDLYWVIFTWWLTLSLSLGVMWNHDHRLYLYNLYPCAAPTCVVLLQAAHTFCVSVLCVHYFSMTITFLCACTRVCVYPRSS